MAALPKQNSEPGFRDVDRSVLRVKIGRAHV